MRIDMVSYERTFNLGNYENEKIHLVAEVEAHEDPQGVLQELKERAYAFVGRTFTPTPTKRTFSNPPEEYAEISVIDKPSTWTPIGG